MSQTPLAFSTRDEIAGAQQCLLQEHVDYCLKNSDYYRGQLGGVNSDQVKLQSLPLTDKSVVSERNEEFIAVPPERAVDIVFSSGTTGLPTKVLYTEADLQRLALNEKLGLSTCGISAADTVLLTCTMDRCFIAGLAYFLGARAIGAASIRNGHGTLESHLDVIRRTNPTVIIGVPTFLRKLGRHIREVGHDPRATTVTKLVCIGEPLRDAQLNPLPLTVELERIWDAKAFCTYASSETVTSFCECDQQRGGHLIPELAMVEIVDDAGNVLPAGETGEVVVTPFGAEGMPLIRYRTGDISFLDTEPCPCGRNTGRIGPILGRRQQMLKVQGTTLYPQSVFALLVDIPQVREFFVEVRDGDSPLSEQLVIHISVADKLDAGALERTLQARLRVRPDIVIAPHAEICKTVFNPQSRKPIRFVDRRTA